jgi:hypothetical protein
MAVLTIQDVSRRSGLGEPTLRYYEQVGLTLVRAVDHGGQARSIVVTDLGTPNADYARKVISHPGSATACRSSVRRSLLFSCGKL